MTTYTFEVVVEFEAKDDGHAKEQAEKITNAIGERYADCITKSELTTEATLEDIEHEELKCRQIETLKNQLGGEMWIKYLEEKLKEARANMGS